MVRSRGLLPIAATRVMQTFSDELSTPVSDIPKC